MTRPKANSDFFKTWSNNMAYILGFIVTDGCLVEHKNGHNGLNITNKNRGILKNILDVMNSDHKISIKSRGQEPKLKYFQIQIRDRAIYADLLKIGLTPRKSKTIRMPDVPSVFFGDFIRGCFDGDGSVSVWQDPRWRHAWQIKVSFYGGNKRFLLSLKKYLMAFGKLRKGTINKCRSYYKLHYGIEDSIKFYCLIYQNGNSLYIKHKRDKFEFFKQARPDCFAKIGPIV